MNGEATCFRFFVFLIFFLLMKNKQLFFATQISLSNTGKPGNSSVSEFTFCFIYPVILIYK